MFRRKDVSAYTRAFTVLSDILALYFAFGIAWLVRFESGWFITLDTPDIRNYLVLVTIWAFVLVLTLQRLNLYNIRTPLPFMSEATRVTQGMLVSVAILFALNFFLRPEYEFSRSTFIIMGLLACIFLLGFREILRMLWGQLLRKKGLLQRVVLMGWNERSSELVDHIRSDVNSGREVVGVIAEDKPASLPREIPWLGKPDELEKILQTHELDEVILGTLQVPHTQISEWILACERNLIQFRLVPDLFEILASRVQLDFISGVPLLGLGEFPLDRPSNRVMKRVLDIVGALIGLILSSPFLIIGAILIRIESPGPIFYVQERCGRDGKPFRMYKLRTMKPDAEKETGPVWTKENDPRRTRVGGFLRSTNIDETPQFLNVLLGKMSLVGPRPERPVFVEQFKEQIRHYMPRHISKPGMTGWAQVNGLRGNTPLDERIRYDIYYFENWSIWFDIRIMMATLFNFKNAY
jgi:exopolysaccharide biosynthesis polyprenyl glycosylphosphotransferase